MFGVRGANGNDHFHLCHCYNEKCIDSRQKQLDLQDRIYPFGYRRCQTIDQITSNTTPVAHTAALQNQPTQLPVSIPLSDPDATVATQYLSGRGFDCEEISFRWNVVYCQSSPESSPQITNRLVIPIYAYRKSVFTQVPEVYLAGWQAREVNTGHATSCKYLSMKGLRKNQLLYGTSQAVATTGPLIIVEGPTDVWRLGTNAVATFGKTISSQQVALLNQHFHDRPILVMFDRDALTESRDAAFQIRSERNKYGITTPVTMLSPPEGFNDVGDCPRDYLWQYIHYCIPTCFASISSQNAFQPAGTPTANPAGTAMINPSGIGNVVNGWEEEL
jgi:hypothetical protein